MPLGKILKHSLSGKIHSVSFVTNDNGKENCVLLNSVQEFIEVEAWLLLTFFLCFTQSINFLYILVSHIKRGQMFEKLDLSNRQK